MLGEDCFELGARDGAKAHGVDGRREILAVLEDVAPLGEMIVQRDKAHLRGGALAAELRFRIEHAADGEAVAAPDEVAFGAPHLERVGKAEVVQRRVKLHNLRRDPGEPERAALARLGAGLDHLVEACIEGDAIVGLAHVAAQPLDHVLLAEEQHHTLATRPPLQRAEMAPGKKALARGGDDALRSDLTADAGKGIGARAGGRVAGDFRPPREMSAAMSHNRNGRSAMRLGWQAQAAPLSQRSSFSLGLSRNRRRRRAARLSSFSSAMISRNHAATLANGPTSQGTLGAAAERGAFGPGAPSLDLRTVTLRRARGGALQEQIPLAGIARHRSRPLELAACLVGAAELGKEVAAHAGQKVVVAQRGVGGKGIDDF